MLLGSPEITPYDLRFQLFRIPIRVHPLFWLIMLMISSNRGELIMSLVFVACAFVSIVVHELGHGLSARILGDEPIEIVLYAMGGYCAFHPHRISPWRRILVLFCGPGAGFVLFGLVSAYLMFRGWPENRLSEAALGDLLYINLVWGVLNLFPLWPLDGGQITSTFLTMVNPRNGARWGHVISMLTAGGIAIWRFTASDLWMGVWFGYFALINYQMLETLQRSYMSSDEGEWWRR